MCVVLAPNEHGGLRPVWPDSARAAMRPSPAASPPLPPKPPPPPTTTTTLPPAVLALHARVDVHGLKQQPQVAGEIFRVLPVDECAGTYRLDQRQNVHNLHAHISANPQQLHCTNLGCPKLATRICTRLCVTLHSRPIGLTPADQRAPCEKYEEFINETNRCQARLEARHRRLPTPHPVQEVDGIRDYRT